MRGNRLEVLGLLAGISIQTYGVTNRFFNHLEKSKERVQAGMGDATKERSNVWEQYLQLFRKDVEEICMSGESNKSEKLGPSCMLE